MDGWLATAKQRQKQRTALISRSEMANRIRSG